MSLCVVALFCGVQSSATLRPSHIPRGLFCYADEFNLPHLLRSTVDNKVQLNSNKLQNISSVHIQDQLDSTVQVQLMKQQPQ